MTQVPPTELPNVPDALRALANLTVTDPRLIFFTKEINLFIEVLHYQGQRAQFSAYDLKMLWARMTDLAHINPLQVKQPEENFAKPSMAEEELKIDLDQVSAPPRRLTPPKLVPPKG